MFRFIRSFIVMDNQNPFKHLDNSEQEVPKEIKIIIAVEKMMKNVNEKSNLNNRPKT